MSSRENRPCRRFGGIRIRLHSGAAPAINMSVQRMSRRDFDIKMNEWDGFLDAARHCFAIGNRRDPAEDLAQSARDSCWKLERSLSNSSTTPPMGDANAVNKFVEKHAHDRLTALAQQIARAQGRSGPASNDRY